MTEHRSSNLDVAGGVIVAALAVFPLLGPFLGPVAIYLGVRIIRPGQRLFAGFLVITAGTVGAVFGTRLIVTSFLEAQMRSSIGRFSADLRSLALNIEAYKADNGFYPPWTPDPGLSAMASDANGLVPSFKIRAARGAATFEEMVDSYPDRTAQPPTDSMAYMSTEDGSSCVLWIAGPDGDYDLPWREMASAIVPEALSPFTYDPTNGTSSNGDMWRTVGN